MPGLQEKTDVDAGTGAVLHGMMSMLAEVLDGLDRRLDGMEARLTALADKAEQPAPEPPPAPQLDTTELYAAIDGVVEQVAARVGAHSDERAAAIEDAVARRVFERVAELEVTLAERLAHLESALAERVSGLDDAVADGTVDVLRKIDTLQLGPRIDQVVGQLCERIGQAEQVVAAHAEQAEQRLVVQLAELGAAVAALRAESVTLPAHLSEQLQAAIGSWRNRLRRGDGDDSAKKAVEELSTALNDGLARLHEAVNRAQGESLSAAQSTIEEVRRLLEPASTTADVEALRTALLDELAKVPAEMDSLRDEVAKLDGTASIAALRKTVLDELTKLGDLVQDTHTRAGTVAASVARQVDDVVQAAVSAVGERVAKERTTADGIRRDMELLGTRIEELGKSVSAGRREFAGTAQGLPDLLRAVIAETDVSAALAAVLDAVNAANQEHQEVLRALHSSLAKRFDARARATADTLDGLTAGLEAARAIGPVLERVGTRLEAQQPFLDQLRHELVQLGAAVGSLPAEMERRHAEAVAAVEAVNDTLGSLRKHAAALDRAVLGMRSSQEGLAAAFIDLRDGSGVVPQRLDHIAASIDQARRQLAEVGEVARSVAGSVEQQQAQGTRLAELVTQVRAATRSDIERVESSIHLEVLKQHQQDQARLTQAVAGVSEVVEREAAVIAQRVAALAGEVDAMRTDLATEPPR